MGIVRYEQNGTVGYGRQREDGSMVAIDDGPAAAAGRAREIALDAAERPVVEGANLLAPVVPTGMLCNGLDYRKHAEESGDSGARAADPVHEAALGGAAIRKQVRAGDRPDG
ncbi:MAG: hypothetical protein OXJ90_27465 [Spirochaetaceae bacterium]|nr:hypothetical protein [Spirochaetaceae bacterium]